MQQRLMELSPIEPRLLNPRLMGMSRLIVAVLLCWVTAAVADGPVSPAELAGFVDGVMAQQWAARPMAGAVVTVVKDDQVWLNRGYGWADIATHRPVDPQRTLFRIGSVSKTFVYLSVMQLIGAGKLDLNRNVNEYLNDMKLAGTFTQPVTLRHLLTHTAGFDEQVVGLFSHSPARVIPLGQRLAREMPVRVRPPGEYSSYSNHGIALAAHLVESVSGASYDDYMEQRVLQPLGMLHTSIRQPLPRTLLDDMASGYHNEGGVLQADRFEIVPLAAVGAVSATGADMSIYMRELLQPTNRLMPPELMLRMRERLFALNPRMPGMLYGFYESSMNPRVFGHGGDTNDFHSEMLLFPEQHLGVFVSYSSDTGAPGRDEFTNAFLDHYFPRAAAGQSLPPAALRKRDLGAYAGWYGSLRVSQHSLAKAALLVSSFQVRASPEGILTIAAPDKVRRYSPAGGDFFGEIDGRSTVLFGRDPHGRIATVGLSSTPPMTFRRLRMYETPVFHAVTFATCMLVFACAVIALPIAAWRAQRTVGYRGDIVGTVASVALAGLLLAFGIGMANYLSVFGAIVFDDTLAPLASLLWLPLIALPVWLLSVWSCVRSYRQRFWSPGRRAFTALIAFAGAVMFLWLFYWNLLGFNYDLV